MCRALLALPGLCLVAFAQSARAQRGDVGGTVRNATGQPIEHALVAIDSGGPTRQLRTDRDGRFHFRNIAAGRHELRITWLGYEPAIRTIDVSADALELTIVLEPNAVRLGEVTVVARRSGVHGTVVERNLLRPLGDARVEVLGARSTDTTEADGRFDFPAVKRGTYMVRVSRPGFRTRTLSISVPADGATELDIPLDTASAGSDLRMEMPWADLGTRIAFRGINSAFVARHELAGREKLPLDFALRSTPSIAKPSLVFDDHACVFVDGLPRPLQTARDFAVEDVEAVEVYGTRSEYSNTLGRRWPRGMPCGNPEGYRAHARLNRALYVVIWLKR